MNLALIVNANGVLAVIIFLIIHPVNRPNAKNGLITVFELKSKFDNLIQNITKILLKSNPDYSRIQTIVEL